MLQLIANYNVSLNGKYIHTPLSLVTCYMIYLVLYRIKITYNSNIVYFMDFRIRYRDLYYLLTILHNMVAKSIRKHSLPGIIENTSGNPGITKNSPGNPGISEKNSENPVFRPPLPLPPLRFLRWSKSQS